MLRTTASRSPSCSSNRSAGSSETSRTGSRQEVGNLTRKRASRPKVRTGCISCKRRRVKCDEGKPGCSRCETMGFVCEGYASPKTKKQISCSIRQSRQLLPRAQPTRLAPGGETFLTPSCALFPLLVAPKMGPDLSGDEYWYFALYHSKVAQDLSPCHGGSFWTRSPLRDSMTRKSIRHSILSIGAYARALIELSAEHPMQYAADRPWWPVAVFNKHREAALTHHAQALACLQREIRASGVDNRATMAATLLFIVFENMMGNYHSSNNLVRSGIRILNDMGRNLSRDFVWKTHCVAFEPQSEIDEMAHIFSRHSITSAFLPFPSVEPTHETPFGHEGVGTASRKDDIIYVYSGTQPNTPRTLEHARAIWEVIYTTVGQFYAKATWRNLNPSYLHDHELFAEQASLTARLHKFSSGLAVLAKGETNERALRRFTFLETHHLVATIVVSCSLDRTESSYDDHTAQFLEIIAKAKAMMSDSPLPNRTAFTNEVGWLPLVAFVALKCRVQRVRRAALNLLRESHWREGPWDGVSLAHAVNNLMKLEGQSGQDHCLHDYVPPPEKRYVWTNMTWDFDHRRMTIEYTKALSNELDKPDKVIHVVDA